MDWTDYTEQKLCNKSWHGAQINIEDEDGAYLSCPTKEISSLQAVTTGLNGDGKDAGAERVAL